MSASFSTLTSIFIITKLPDFRHGYRDRNSEICGRHNGTWLRPAFDLSQAYWLVTGIAGIDPEDASIGSVAWSSFLVDGDLGHEIDAREIPAIGMGSAGK